MKRLRIEPKEVGTWALAILTAGLLLVSNWLASADVVGDADRAVGHVRAVEASTFTTPWRPHDGGTRTLVSLGALPVNLQGLLDRGAGAADRRF